MKKKFSVKAVALILHVFLAAWGNYLVKAEELVIPDQAAHVFNAYQRECMVGCGEDGETNIIYENAGTIDHAPGIDQRDSSIGVSRVMGNTPLSGEVEPENFSELALVENPDDWPYRANVYLEISFSDQELFAGSGVLIDPKHVITAGHCVWNGAWANSIKITPGYETYHGPWGSAIAHSWQLFSWNEWVEKQNFDDDVGIVYFERPVGAITGWFGYGYNDDPNFYTNHIFNNPGYPGNPPYDGQHMYNWSGNFDGTECFLGLWYGKEVWVSSIPVQGQSGSGAYYSDNGGYTVYAVSSNGVANRGNYPRITSAKFNHIRDLIQSHTPSTPDLIPLNVRTTPPIIHAGEQLSSMSYLVHNYSSAQWQGANQIDVYLSPDSEITADDTLISSHTINGILAPKRTVMINLVTPPFIPVTTPVDRINKKWIGIILHASDYDTANNVTGSSDASAIEVDWPLNTTTTLTKTTSTTTPVIITIDPTTTIIDDDCPIEIIYGTNSNEAAWLRYFRDAVLSQTIEGKALITLFYQSSPFIVKAMQGDEEFKEWVKEMTNEVLSLLQEDI